MEIREYKNYKEAEILQLYTEVGWTAYTENMPLLEQGYKNSLSVPDIATTCRDHPKANQTNPV